MKQKITYSCILLLLITGTILLLKNQKKTETPKTETTYSAGKTQQLYIKGKGTETTKTKTIRDKATLHPAGKDSAYTYTKSDTAYKLTLNIKQEKEGELTLDYILSLTTKELIRTDTIKIIRIDTLKITQTITEKTNAPIYDTFLFGAAATALIIILILKLIPY